MKLASTVLYISNWGCDGNFFNMIYRVLIKFNQNLSKNQDFKEHKLLTINVLIIFKDQLIIDIVVNGMSSYSNKCLMLL